MLLRRITQHVKDQNWFAVGIDFIIVVIGVFIGIQVANWNDVRQERVSEVQYLERFADEIELTIAHLRDERSFATESSESIEAFSAALFREDVSDAALVSAAKGYLTSGAFFANFRPHRTTFDDLVSTGNVDIITDEAIRVGLVRLHANYKEAQEVIESNISWIQQGEDAIYYHFDAFRYDRRTKILFDEASAETLANDVRERRDLLRRHAAFHYWLKARSIEIYDEIEPEADAVLALIHAELERR